MTRSLWQFSDLAIEGDLIDRVCESQISLIRWGDGETLLMLGIDTRFEHATKNLQIALLDLWLAGTSKEAGFLFGLPLTPLEIPYLDLSQSSEGKHWWKTRMLFGLVHSRGNGYFDSICFRNYGDRAFPLIDPSPIWETSDKLLVIHSKPEVFDAFCAKYASKAVSQILVKSSFAFSDYALIETLTLSYLERNSGPDAPLVLVACGPVGKVLSFRHHEKAQFVDLGHYWQRQFI